MKRLLLFTFVTFLLCSFTTQDKNKTITIYMIGDSTMANKSLKGGNVERGWGQMLSGFFKSDKVSVENHALNGRSSKSFIDEGLWDKVISKVQQGDYVFVEFGHNDEKPDSVRHTDPGSTFDDNLRRFVNETRSKGGIPVLFNAITRRHFEGDSLIDTHGTYLESPRQVAKELNVTFIDLNRATSNLVQQLGNNASKSLYVWVPAHTLAACPNGREDNTHLNIYGARQVTGLAVDSIEQKIPELAPFIQRYD
jgi:pectinesterase